MIYEIFAKYSTIYTNSVVCDEGDVYIMPDGETEHNKMCIG